MPIPVKCPECAYRFHVDEAFAGSPGRCPECDAVIQVPAAETHPDDDAFPADPRIEEFPSASRRAVDRYEYSPTRTERREEPRFNPGPRIEKWKKVAAGFRNLAIAAGLIGIDTAIRGAFNLANGIPKNDNELTSAQKALAVGEGLFTCLAIILWAFGRIALMRTPYLPAGASAKSSGVLAGITAVPGVIGMGMMAAGILIVQNNLLAGMAILQLGMCGLGICFLGWVVAEIVGLIAQIQIMKGLEAAGASLWAKFHLAGLITMLTVGTIGSCVLFVALFSEMQQQAAKNGNNPPVVNAKNAPAPKGGEKKAPANQNNPNNPPPPPQFNPEEHKELVIVVIVVTAGGTIGFSMLCVFSFLAAQGAIKREIVRLSGGLDGNPDDWHNRSPVHVE
ncbi:hypothetical protein [Zavarzinella formosa]|uniref:hypothetical protein n=1 Tax=Zavarzinella formosa TaxID=360055 RepID=UPI0003060309|nr:hypothetical protein [Zavarzinella formosa]